MINNFQELVSFAATLPAKQVVVIYPRSEEIFLAVKQA
jgi:hypothetical protein